MMRERSRENLSLEKIIATLKSHNDILRKYSVKKIGIFGSYLRGEQNKHSDIDFLVEFYEPTFDNFMDLVFFLEGLFQKKVELITNGNLSPYIQPFVEKEVKWYDA